MAHALFKHASSARLRAPSKMHSISRSSRPSQGRNYQSIQRFAYSHSHQAPAEIDLPSSLLQEITKTKDVLAILSQNPLTPPHSPRQKKSSEKPLSHWIFTRKNRNRPPHERMNGWDINQRTRCAWMILVGILLTGAFFLTHAQAEEKSEEPSWEELEQIAKRFELNLDQYKNDLKKATHACFQAIFEACCKGDWGVIDTLDPLVLSKLTDMWGQTLLIAAANLGNASVVQMLMERKVSLEKTDREGNTPLHIAAKNGFHHLVPLLWDYYINDLNEHGKTPLHFAIEFGHVLTVQALIDQEAQAIPLKQGNFSLTPLALCVRYNQKECLEAFLKRPNYRLDEYSKRIGTLLHVAIQFGQLSMLKSLLERENATALLDKTDGEGRNPMALACYLGDLEAVHFLFPTLNTLNHKEQQGWTLAHWAVLGKQKKILEYLAYQGYDLDIKREGKTPKDLLEGDLILEAKALRNVLTSLIDKAKNNQDTRLDFLREPPTVIVLKGGGPRGLAYLEALLALEEEGLLNDVRKVAGTSAGSITAAIFALDPHLRNVEALNNLNTLDFLDAVPGKEPLLNSVLKGKEAQNFWEKMVAVGKEMWNPIKVYQAFSKLEGICAGENLLQWIEGEIFKRTGIPHCTFGELRKEIQKGKGYLHLHVFATRLEASDENRIHRFSSEDSQWDNIVISDAIRASASIPGVFKPFIVREKTSIGALNPRSDLGPFVDGGLLDNFPIHAFDDSPGKHYNDFNRRTLGLCLKDVKEPSLEVSKKVEGIVDIAKECALIYFKAQESWLGKDQKEKDRIIEIPIQGVGLLDFDLKKEQRESLLNAGRTSIEQAFPKAKRDKTERIHVHLKASNAPQKLADFRGRTVQLRTLEKTLISNIKPSPQNTIVRLIYGLGGMGKTELVRTFVSTHLNDFSVVWFINCATQEQKNQSYRDLAEKLNIPILDKEPPESIQMRVHTYLKTHAQHTKPWLLVYDNVEKPVSSTEIPQGGYLLMTSRHKNVWRDDQDKIELTELRPEESVEILSNITHQSSPAVLDLAKELGHFPLALNEAAHYILESQCSIETYLKALKQNPLKAGMSTEARYEHTVRNVWKITLEKLKNEHEKAYYWLDLFAQLNPDNIPINWIDDEIEKMEVIRTLMNFSLISEKKGIYSIHRLLQQAVKSTQNEPEIFQEAVKLIEKKREGLDKDTLTSWQEARIWVGQVDYIILSSLFPNLDEIKQQGQLLHTLGLWKSKYGDLKEGLKYFQKVLEISNKNLGEQNSATLSAYNNVGRNLEMLGQYEEALKYFQKMLEIQITTLGEQHPDIVDSYNTVGFILIDLAEYQKGLEYLQKGLEIRKNTLGEEHPDTANSYDLIGKCLKNLGRREEALQHHQKSLEIRTKILDEQHPSIAASYHLIGSCLKDAEYSADLHKKALEIERRVLGEQHPDTAKSYSLVAMSLSTLNRNEEALDYQKKALEITKKTLGEQHADVASMYIGIGMCFYKLNRQEEALEYFQKALEIRKKSLGEQHPQVAENYILLGDFLQELNRQKEALEYTKQGVEMMMSQKHFKHPDTLQIYQTLADRLAAQGQYEGALQYHQKLLEVIKRNMKEEEYLSFIIEIYRHIGSCLGKLNRHEEALQYHQKILDLSKEGLEEVRYPAYFLAALNLLDLNRHEEAIEYAKKGLNGITNLQEESDTSNFLDGFIEILKVSDKKLCETARDQMLAPCTEKWGANHPSIQNLKKACSRGWFGWF